MTKSHPQINENSRAVVAGIIERWLNTGQFPQRLIPDETNDRAFVMEAVYGITRWFGMLQWVADKLAAKKPKRPTIPYILTGLYQILIMDNVPEYASVFETVSASKIKLGHKRAGFVNGLLRSAIRKKANILAELDEQSLAIRISHPEIIVKRWTQRMGVDKTNALCKWNNLRPSVCIRANPMRTTSSDLLKMFYDAKIDAKPHPAAPDNFIMIPSGIPVFDLPGYSEGMFTVQDPSTLNAVRMLDPQPGESILDTCAAPGGKTIAIAEAMQDRGILMALDLYADRLGPLRENIKRMGITCVSVALCDARKGENLISIAGKDRCYDAILLDVPCSNTGVLRRRPDARWRFSEEKLSKLLKTQRTLLDSALSVLAPDGRLVYSTCSLEPEENEDMVSSWLENNPDFHLVKETKAVPPESQTDGAYIAVLSKVR